MIQRTTLSIVGCLSLLLGGCFWEKGMDACTIQSRGESSARLATAAVIEAWSAGEASTRSIILSDFTPDQLSNEQLTGTIVHLDLLWEPTPGKTPLVPTATNFVCRVLVFSQGEMGLYGGGGFGWPDIDSSAGTLTLDISGCSISLLEKTSGFHDLLTPAEIRGRLVARRADALVTKLQRSASQLVSNRLGAVHWVHADESARAPSEFQFTPRWVAADWADDAGH